MTGQAGRRRARSPTHLVDDSGEPGKPGAGEYGRRSVSSMPKRTSGLSVPKRSMASDQVTGERERWRYLAHRFDRSRHRRLDRRLHLGLLPEGAFQIELGELDLTVGAGSPRRGSSGRSGNTARPPETIKSCLNSCGDCGRAKKLPGWCLLGTRRSRAPSGVDRISVGVSTKEAQVVERAPIAATARERATRLAAMRGRRRSR